MPSNSGSDCNRNTCEDAGWAIVSRGLSSTNYGWALASMFTTSLMTGNYLKYTLVKTYAKRSFFTSLFLWFLMDTSMKLYFVIMANLSQIWYFFSALSSEANPLTPFYFFLNFGISNSSPNARRVRIIYRIAHRYPCNNIEVKITECWLVNEESIFFLNFASWRGQNYSPTIRPQVA